MADSPSGPTTAAKPRLAEARTQSLAGRLMREHVRPQGQRIAFALGCMTVVAATTAALAKQLEPIPDQVFAERSWDKLVHVTLSLLAIFIDKGTAGSGTAAAMHHDGQRLVAHLRGRLFSRTGHVA